MKSPGRDAAWMGQCAETMGTDHLLESEQDAHLSEEERRDLRRDHTRMLYMGFTRAGQRLVVLRCGRKTTII